MLQYNTGYIILDNNDNPNNFSELQGNQKQNLAINKVSGNIWVFNNSNNPKWLLASPFARNVGNGVEITKSTNGVLQFKTLTNNIETCNNKREGDYIEIRDLNQFFSEDKTSFTDLLRQTSVLNVFDNMEYTPTLLQIASVNTTNKTFTLTSNSLTTYKNLNKLRDGQKWIAYRLNHSYLNGKYKPKWIIDKVVGNTFYYTIVTDVNETLPNPVVGDYIEFLNPYVNYTHIKEDETPIFPDLSPGNVFEGYTIQYNHPLGIMNKGENFAMLFILTVNGVGLQDPQKRLLVYSISEDLITWSTPEIIDLLSLDLNGINQGTDVFYTVYPYYMTHLEEAGKSSDRYFIKCGVGLWDEEANNIEYYNGWFIINEDFEIEYSRINGEINNFFGNSFTKYNGRFRVLYKDISNNIIEKKIEGEIEDILENPTDTNPNLIITTTNILPNTTGSDNISKFFIATPLSYKYIKYNEKLHLCISAQMKQDYSGSHSCILKAHPAIYIATLNEDENTWIWHKSNPFITAPMNWQLIGGDYATKYQYISGGLENFIPFSYEDDIYFLTGLSQSIQAIGVYDLANYLQTYLLKLNNFTNIKLSDIDSSTIEVTGNYTQKNEKNILVSNSTNPEIYIQLRPAKEWNNETIIIKKTAGGGIVFAAPYSGETIDGSTSTININIIGDSIVLKSIGNDIIRIN